MTTWISAMQQSHRDLRNKFAHAPTRRAEYFNQLEQKKSILRELEHDNKYNDAPQSPAVRTGARPLYASRDAFVSRDWPKVARSRRALAIDLNLN
jgi:hypothetical protein